MGFRSVTTVTRPANTTAYSAGDVVGGAITFTSVGAGGRDVFITNTALRIDVAAVPAGMTSFTLHLYDVTPPSAIADNAAWDLPSGDRASYLGSIALGTPADVGSTLYIQADQVNKQIRPNTANTVFAYLVTAAGYTPAGNSEVYAVELNAVSV